MGIRSFRGGATNSAGDWATAAYYELDLDRGIAGGYVGCQWQKDAWVAGFEADGDWSDANDSQTIIATDPEHVVGTHIRGTGSARARFGWAADRLLLYVTGGWAIAGVKTTYAVTGSPPLHTEDTARNG